MMLPAFPCVITIPDFLLTGAPPLVMRFSLLALAPRQMTPDPQLNRIPVSPFRVFPLLSWIRLDDDDSSQIPYWPFDSAPPGPKELLFDFTSFRPVSPL